MAAIVTVTGDQVYAPGLFAAGDRLFIGQDVDSSLLINNDAVPVLAYLKLGGAAGVKGGLTLSGVGSNLDLSSSDGVLVLGDIGEVGTGNLTINEGGTLSVGGGAFAHEFSLGSKSSGDGTLTVSGAGSSFDVRGGTSVVVGDAGTGTLNIESGGTVTVGSYGISLGAQSTGLGTVTVSGTGSSLHDSGAISIGSVGQGALNVEDGGAIELDGARAVYVGDAGTGTLNIESGGTVTVGSYGIALGAQSTGLGTVTVSGTGSSLHDSGVMSIGSVGQGAVNVEDGGAIGLVGAGTVHVGDAGTGTLNIESGGTVTVGGYGIDLGAQSTGFGTVTVSGTGSSLHDSGVMSIGSVGQGAVNVESGGTVTVGSYGIALGAQSTGFGAVTVSGTGSSLHSSHAMSIGSVGQGAVNVEDGGAIELKGASPVYVGDAGTGTLNIESGGTVTVGSYGIALGAQSTGFGTVTVSGTGSLLHSSHAMNIGSVGQGAVNVEDGGAIELDGAVAVHVGDAGTGTLNIESGGTVTVGGYGIDLGAQSTGSGTVTVSGTESSLHSKGVVMVGKAGVGSLNVGDGGKFATDGTLTLGSTDGSSGTLVIGAAAGNMAVASGTVDTGDGDIHVGAGTGNLIFNHTDSNYDFSKNLVVATGGTLNLNVLSGATTLTTNAWAGNTALNGGTLRLGNSASLGAGDLTFNGGTLDLGTDSTVHQVATLRLNSGTLRYDPSTSTSVALTEATTGNWFDNKYAFAQGLISATTLIGSPDALSLEGSGDDGLLRAAIHGSDGSSIGTGAWQSKLAQQDTTLGIAIKLQSVAIDQGKALSLDLVDAGSTAATFGATLTGDGGVSLDAEGGTMTFGNALNTYAGTTALTGGSIDLATDNALGRTSALSLGSSSTLNLGGHRQTVGRVDAAAGSTLSLGGGTLSLGGGTLDGSLAGGGSLAFTGGSTAISGANAGLDAAVNIASSATVTLSQGSGLGTGSVTLGGVLALQGDEATTFANALSGNGSLDMAAGSPDTAVTLSGLDAFTGTVNLVKGHYTLDATSSPMLDKATVVSGAGNLLTVGTATTGALGLAGGTLDLADQTPVTVKSLSMSGGTIAADLTGIAQGQINTQDLLTSGDSIERTLIHADAGLSGSASNLTLKDSNDAALEPLSAELKDGAGGSVGLGSWGLKLAQVSNDLNVAWGLQGVNLYQGRVLALNLADSGATEGTFDAALSGMGGVSLDAAGGSMTFGNATNTYTGVTTLKAGTVDLSTDNALGATSGLSLAADASLHLNGHTQAVGQLTTAANSSLTLGGGALSVSGGTVDGSLSGTGALTFADGNTLITGANGGLQSAVRVARTASVTLSQGNGLGGGDLALDGALVLGGATQNTLSNVVAGDGSLTSTGEWVLDHDNAFSGGTTVSAGSLALLTSAAAGTGGIVNNALLTLEGTSDATLNNALSGNGRLVKSGTNAWTVAQDNPSFDGAVSVATGALVLKTANALGAASIDNAAALRLSGVSGTLNNAVTGAGQLTATDGTQVVMDGLAAFSGTLSVDSGSQVSTTDVSNVTSGIIDGRLAVAAAAGQDLTLGHAWQGSGALDLSAGSADATFHLSGLDAFAGTVNLAKGHYTLDVDGSAMLGHATLVSGVGSTVTLGTNATGALGLAGGTLDLVDQEPLTAQSFNMTSGTIAADLSSLSAGQSNTNDLFTSGDQVRSTLIHTVAGGLSGSASNLTLVDRQGTSLNPLVEDIKGSGGDVIGQGSWGLKLSQQSDDLDVAWGLRSMDVYDGKVLALNLADSGATTATFDAALSGSGGVLIDATGGTLTYGNAVNTYTGSTSLTAGTVDLATDNALGATSHVSLTEGTALNLQGHTQAVGALDSAAGSVLDLGGGTFGVGGGTIAGALAGSGTLNFTGGSTAISSGNAGLSAVVDVAPAATVTLSKVTGLGSGPIAIGGLLALQDVNGVLTNALSGLGTLSIDPSDVTLSGDNRGFTGVMRVADAASVLRVRTPENLGDASVANAGTLVVDTSTDWSLANPVTGNGNFIKDGVGTLTVGPSLQSTGTTTVDAGTLILGQGSGGASLIQVNAGATLAAVDAISSPVVNQGTLQGLSAAEASDQASRDLRFDAGLTNAGLLDISTVGGASDPGSSVTVRGGYVGNSGAVRLRTVLGGDAAATDRLVIDGGQATGSTSLIVENAGGVGAKTSMGIDVVKTTNGATTANDAFSLDSRSTGYRQQYGTIAAGAYDYTLKRGGNGGVADDWYLVSKSNFRPEVGTYLANRRAASSLFDVSVQERMGRASDRSHGNTDDDHGLWAYASGGTVSYAETHGEDITLDSSRFLTGINAYRADMGANGTIRVGAMAGYGRVSTSSRQASTSLRSDGTVKGVTGGVYGAWFANGQEPVGAYVNGELRYGSYRNVVHGEGLGEERYDASDVAMSFETGYGFRLNDAPGRSVYLEPRVRVIYDRFHQADHTEISTASQVVANQPDNVAYSVGLGLHGSFGAPGRQLQPFASLDWYRSSRPGSVSIDDLRVDSEAARSHFEVKTGATAELRNNLSAWAGLGLQVGPQKYDGVSLQAGLRYVW
ncbi:autotransporter outer membrane beta-barrel domain-containing protein [Xanthomonas cassavae]